MEGKRTVTHPTNTTGPKARMKSSSDSKKNLKTKIKQQKNPTQKVKTT